MLATWLLPLAYVCRPAQEIRIPSLRQFLDEISAPDWPPRLHGRALFEIVPLVGP